LLVEDNHANRIVASNFLGKMGVKVDFAENGAQALQIVQEQQFDIVLMDLQMPVMDGYEATREIRKLGKKYKKLPIIALTADVVSDVRQKVNESGMNDYLSKPFKPEQLNSTIAKNLNIKFQHNPSEEDNVMTLCQILDEYSDDTQFVTTLLESLKSSFDKLSQQIRETARERDIYSLRRIMHKLQPSVKMLEDQKLYPKLESLKHILAEDEVNDTELRLLLEDIHKATKDSVHYLDMLQKKAYRPEAKV
jgi:CheY-like chemotaxis protein